MGAHSPHHAILLSLLDKKQFEACRTTVEDMITDQLNEANPCDSELAQLHIIHCRSLYGLLQYQPAGEKADIAAFLARKLKDNELLGEALYRAGVCFGVHGDQHTAIQRFSGCIETGVTAFRGEAFYSRGYCYVNVGAYSSAVSDYEAALNWAAQHDSSQARKYRINLAWALLLDHRFDRAELVLCEASQEPGASEDRTLQLQISHDRAHMAYLLKQGRTAFHKAMVALRQSGREFPHIRAHIALTLMGLATDHEMPQEAFSLGVLAKRLAGQALRADLDDEASRKMQALELDAGTDCLVKSLCETGQVLRGALNRRKSQRGATESGGSR
jgi:tetratricopeptide (TPR) repeat protein